MNCAATTGLCRPAKNVETNQSTTLHNLAKSPAKAAKKRAYDRLLGDVFDEAASCGLIDVKDGKKSRRMAA